MTNNRDPFNYTANLILRAKPDFEYAREPLLRRMPNGDLVCVCLSGGKTEPANQNLVIISRSKDDGCTWSAPEIIFQHSERAVWATELFCHDNTVCLFLMTYYSPSRYRELILYRSFSIDNGETWSEPQSLPNGIISGSVRQGIVLSNGAWVFPIYWQECCGAWDWKLHSVPNDGIDENWPFRCGVLRTEDNGKSFHIEGYLKAQTPLWENNIAEYENGKLVMLMRAEFTGYLYRSFSDDYGKTWSKPEKTDIPNPASKITLLKSGNNILLIHNPTMCQEFCDWNKRKPLEMWVSSDGTRTWNKKIPLTKVDEPFFYPHGFVDSQKNLIYIACENSQEHFLLKIPINEIEG